MDSMHPFYPILMPKTSYVKKILHWGPGPTVPKQSRSKGGSDSSTGVLKSSVTRLSYQHFSYHRPNNSNYPITFLPDKKIIKKD